MIITYDPYVVNAMIEIHQMTATWHVEDIKVSNKDPCHITKFTSYILIIYDEKLAVK